jgi:hypothetical protein
MLNLNNTINEIKKDILLMILFIFVIITKLNALDMIGR